MNKAELQQLAQKLESNLDQLHQQQVARARGFAHRIRADLTSEDLLNPDNFPEVIQDPDFMYEDGLAAGILAAKIATLAQIRELLLSLAI